MNSFDKPDNLNGAELRQELNVAGIKISYYMSAVVVDGEKLLWLDIAKSDAHKARVIVAAHNGTI